jgi:hypothetical protein
LSFSLRMLEESPHSGCPTCRPAAVHHTRLPGRICPDCGSILAIVDTPSTRSEGNEPPRQTRVGSWVDGRGSSTLRSVAGTLRGQNIDSVPRILPEAVPRPSTAFPPRSSFDREPSGFAPLGLANGASAEFRFGQQNPPAAPRSNGRSEGGESDGRARPASVVTSRARRPVIGTLRQVGQGHVRPLNPEGGAVMTGHGSKTTRSFKVQEADWYSVF